MISTSTFSIIYISQYNREFFKSLSSDEQSRNDKTQWWDFVRSWLTGLPRLIAIVPPGNTETLSSCVSALTSAAKYEPDMKFFIIELNQEMADEEANLFAGLLGMTASSMISESPLLLYMEAIDDDGVQCTFSPSLSHEALNSTKYRRYWKQGVFPMEDSVAEFLREVQEGALQESSDMIIVPDLHFLTALNMKLRQKPSLKDLFSLAKESLASLVSSNASIRIFVWRILLLKDRVIDVGTAMVKYVLSLWREVDRVGSDKEEL